MQVSIRGSAASVDVRHRLAVECSASGGWHAEGQEVVPGIYQLAGPKGSVPRCDIVLFHGLSLDGENTPESYFRTWRDAGVFPAQLHAVAVSQAEARVAE